MMARRTVWWLWPSVPLCLFVLPTLVIAVLLPADVYEEAWRTPKAIEGRTFTLMAMGTLVFALGTMVAAIAERPLRNEQEPSWPALSQRNERLLRRLYPWLFGATLVGYLAWIGNGLRNGLAIDDIRTVLTSQDNFLLPIKAKLETIPGVSTLTQVAMTAAIVGVLVDLTRPSARVRWSYRLLLALATVRAEMLAERLAVAEILVPVLVLRAAAYGMRSGRRGRRRLAWAPIVAIAVLLCGFSASEYSRSWIYYREVRDQPFAVFAAERLMGYYATSHNNGALLIEHVDRRADTPYYTTAFFWEVPPGTLLAPGLAPDAQDRRGEVLRDFGNPEFNSPSGVASPFADYSVIGGLTFFAAHGLAVGAAHVSFMRGRAVGLLLYPLAYVGLLELPRYLYWYQGRSTPALAAAAMVALAMAANARWRLHQIRLTTERQWAAA